jgi:hypothetical protein
MSNRPWIVCERTGRWAAALRTAIAREASAGDRFRLQEVRSLVELTTQIGEKQPSLVLIEVTGASLEPVLSWLAAEATTHRALRAAALLSEDFVQSARWGREPDRRGCQEVIDSLFEAGVLEIASSPRHLRHILLMGRQCAAADASRAAQFSLDESFADWASTQLPWQEA